MKAGTDSCPVSNTHFVQIWLTSRIPKTTSHHVREDGSKECRIGQKRRSTGRSDGWSQSKLYPYRFRIGALCRIGRISSSSKEEESLHSLPTTTTTQQARYATGFRRILPQTERKRSHREEETGRSAKGKGRAKEGFKRRSLHRSSRDFCTDHRGKEEEKEGWRSGCVMRLMYNGISVCNMMTC